MSFCSRDMNGCLPVESNCLAFFESNQMLVRAPVGGNHSIESAFMSTESDKDCRAVTKQHQAAVGQSFLCSSGPMPCASGQGRPSLDLDRVGSAAHRDGATPEHSEDTLDDEQPLPAVEAALALKVLQPTRNGPSNDLRHAEGHQHQCVGQR